MSRFCLCCGNTGDGRPILLHLRENSGVHGHTGFGIVDLFFLLIALIGQFFGSRKRTIAFGLCEVHQSRRKKLIRISAVATLAAVLGFIVPSIILLSGRAMEYDTNFWIVMMVLVSVGAPALLIFAYLIASRLPRPKLYKEVGSQMWLTWVGEGFINAQRALVATPARET